MTLGKIALNNIVNFTTSEYIRLIFNGEELLSEFSKFAFNLEKNEIFQCLGQTFMSPVLGDYLNEEASISNLVAKVQDFSKLKNLESKYIAAIPALIDPEATSIKKIKTKYGISYSNAKALMDLKNSLL